MRLLSIGVVVLGMLAGGTGAMAQDAGAVLTFKGECFVEAGGQRAMLKIGDTVHVGDTLDVPDGAKLKIRMNDGSVIAAAPGTRMTITAFQSDGKGGPRDADLTLASGLLRAVVAPAGQPSRFEVETATGVAAVRSTDWFVEAEPKTLRVGVLSGVVSLTSRATVHSVNIPARWGAKLEAGHDPGQPRIWQQEEFERVIGLTKLD